MKADDGTRTRDILLGKQALYQLSYVRKIKNLVAKIISYYLNIIWKFYQYLCIKLYVIVIFIKDDKLLLMLLKKSD